MNKKSLGYVILKIIGKIAFFLVLVYIAGLVIDHIFQYFSNRQKFHSGNTDSGCTVNVYRIL